MNGIILLNKPTGLSSFKAIRIVQKTLNLKKVGHCGTLDPLATGMLPIMVNEATKYSQYVLSNNKAYTVEMKLGVISDTFDTEGTIKPCNTIPESLNNKVENIIQVFHGKQQQLPPNFSAIKVNGQRAYQLARQGIQFELKQREINIFKIELMSIENDLVKIYVECSKGTFIRTLVNDIGKKLGCGAIMTKLHRNWVTPFSGSKMYTLDSINEYDLIPIKSLFKTSIIIENNDLLDLKQGKYVTLKNEFKHLDINTVAITSDTGEFIGIGNVDTGILKPKRLLSTN